MRVLPILFNTNMVRAVLREENPKIATRRVVKGCIPDDAMWGYTAFTPKGDISCRGTYANGYGEKFFKLPYQIGDILYVRETWQYLYEIDGNDKIIEETGRYYYAATDTLPFDTYVDSMGVAHERIPWRPSIHMPKEAARIWLKVTDVCVKWLQDMTLGDFLNEGISVPYEAFNDPENAFIQAEKLFIQIWDSVINKKQHDLYGWNANPWVWVIEFERCEKPKGSCNCF